MSYLDPKERVIDLQLTSYGRHLLAIGKLDPKYYAFFDDDVIYDANYASVDEDSDNVTPRVLEDTPRFSSQAIFSARETAVFEATPNVVNDLTIGQDIERMTDKDKQLLLAKTRIQEGPEKTEVLQQPLGSSNSAYSTAPAWNVSFLSAPMSGSTEYLQVSGTKGTYYKDIPQLEVEIQYRIERYSPEYNKNLNSNPFALGQAGEENDGPQSVGVPNTSGEEGFAQEPIKFESGASIAGIAGKPLILRLEESNTFFQGENFEIECFEVETIEGSEPTEKLIPLKYYLDNNFQEKDDINSISQYLDVWADTEIPLESICPDLKRDTTRQFFHRKIFECEGFTGQDAIDSYTEEDSTGDICE